MTVFPPISASRALDGQPPDDTAQAALSAYPTQIRTLRKAANAEARKAAAKETAAP